jgi:hypothetical protein
MTSIRKPAAPKTRDQVDLNAEIRGTLLSEAAQRLGQTWIDELRWLLGFVQRERQEVVEEIAKPDSALVFDAIWFSRDADLVGLQDQNWILQAFDALKSEIATFVEQGNAVIELDKVTFVLFNRRAAGREKGREVELYYRSKDPATRLILAANRLLELEGKRIAKCDAPNCGRLYVREKRARFCSKRCSQKEQSRRWRERHPGVQKQRQREYYERKVKQKVSQVHGRKVVAVRVPRRTPGGSE